MKVLIAEVEPDHHEIEGSRAVDFLQAEQVAVKVSAPVHVGDDYGTVVDLFKLQCIHSSRSLRAGLRPAANRS
jgi:hypothetical protein